MKRIEHHITNFRCIICHKSWAGMVYLDYCQDGGLELFDDLNGNEKKILRMNIYSLNDEELRKSYLKSY